MKSIVRILLLLGAMLSQISCSEEPKKATPASPTAKTEASQAFMGGYIMDEAAYGDAPDPADVQEDTKSLPSSMSLEADCPPVAHQAYNTCVAWSLAEARAILYKKATGQSMTFSTGFLYALAKEEPPTSCITGLRFEAALEQLKTVGIVPQAEAPNECIETQNVENQTIAAKYRIKNKDRVAISSDCKAIKRCLANGKPVVVGMALPHDIELLKTPIWNPSQDRIEKKHAMLVVGYDDNKEGGAVRLMNSWGKGWGENGFAWVRYADFTRFAKEAWDIAAEESAQITAGAELGGNIEFRRTPNAQKLTVIKEPIADPVAFKAVYKGIQTADIPKNYWCIKEPLRSESQFEMLVQNQVGCYMYALSTGASKAVDVLFPNKPKGKRVNAFVSGGKSVRLPAGEQAFTLDKKVGTDMMCLLYSKNRLDVDDIAQKIQQKHQNLPFVKAVETVLGSQLVDNQNVTFGSGGYKGIQSTDKKGQVLMVVVAVQHVK